MHTLAYMTPAANRRPGILTTIGVLSIVLACLSGLSGLSGVMSGIGFLMMSRITTTAPPTTLYSTSIVNGRSVTTTAPIAATTFPFPFSRRMSVVTLFSAVLTLTAAIVLLIAGISVIRDSPKGARRHWIYVWVKLPIVLLSTVISAMTYKAIFGRMAGSMPPGPLGGGLGTLMVVFSVAGSLIISLAYPVTLMIVFSTRRVRDYYLALTCKAPIR